jgi:hypothetical protein
MPEFTIIEDGAAHQMPANVAGNRVGIQPDALQDALGWQLKPEGLCKDDVCVPVRDRDTLLREGDIDLGTFAAALGCPLAVDTSESAAAIGTPSSALAQQLASLEAPDFTLPDLDGRSHSLSDYRGKKVLLIAYASW